MVHPDGQIGKLGIHPRCREGVSSYAYRPFLKRKLGLTTSGLKVESNCVVAAVWLEPLEYAQSSNAGAGKDSGAFPKCECRGLIG
jgi:hypothetical protein